MLMNESVSKEEVLFKPGDHQSSAFRIPALLYTKKKTLIAAADDRMTNQRDNPNEIKITETLLANRTVVLNLEGLDVDIAQRIIDFTSGSCFAMSGNLQKISHYIFIITPASVDISGDFQELLSGAFDVPINN